MGRQAKIRARRKLREAKRRANTIDDLTGTGYSWPRAETTKAGGTDAESRPDDRTSAHGNAP